MREIWRFSNKLHLFCPVKYQFPDCFVTADAAHNSDCNLHLCFIQPNDVENAAGIWFAAGMKTTVTRESFALPFAFFEAPAFASECSWLTLESHYACANHLGHERVNLKPLELQFESCNFASRPLLLISSLYS